MASNYNNSSVVTGKKQFHVPAECSCGHWCEYERGGRCCGCSRVCQPCSLCLDVAVQWMNRLQPEIRAQGVTSMSEHVRRVGPSAQLPEQPPPLPPPPYPPSNSVSVNPTHSQAPQLLPISSSRLCKIGCGRICAPGIYLPTSKQYTTCWQACASNNGRLHDDRCAGPARAGSPNSSLGRVGTTRDQAQRSSSQGQISSNRNYTQPAQLPQSSGSSLCKMRCGRNCAPGIYDPTNKPFKTCCRACGLERGHDRTCRG
jgi:hypothetical protein